MKGMSINGVTLRASAFYFITHPHIIPIELPHIANVVKIAQVSKKFHHSKSL